MNKKTLLSVKNIHVTTKTQPLLKNITFNLSYNETLCIVGESGSGKSMTLRAILGILPSPSLEISSGLLIFKDQELSGQSKEERRLLRMSSMGFVPQSPHSSLNPMLSIGWQMKETLKTQGFSKQEIQARAVTLLHKVGFSNPEHIMSLRPHQLSGGMKQRALIASSLMNSPPILLLDEPTTALDVTLQAEILSLLHTLKREFSFSMILVTHDLRVVSRMADRVLVMKEGSIIEAGKVDTLLLNPSHSYTRELIDSLGREV